MRVKLIEKNIWHIKTQIQCHLSEDGFSSESFSCPPRRFSLPSTTTGLLIGDIYIH